MSPAEAKMIFVSRSHLKIQFHWVGGNTFFLFRCPWSFTQPPASDIQSRGRFSATWQRKEMLSSQKMWEIERIIVSPAGFICKSFIGCWKFQKLSVLLAGQFDWCQLHPKIKDQLPKSFKTLFESATLGLGNRFQFEYSFPISSVFFCYFSDYWAIFDFYDVSICSHLARIKRPASRTLLSTRSLSVPQHGNHLILIFWRLHFEGGCKRRGSSIGGELPRIHGFWQGFG